MAKIIHYRSGCIGCNICYEMQPTLWRMSKKDGKATLLRSIAKKDVFILPLADNEARKIKAVIKACPVKIIKLV